MVCRMNGPEAFRSPKKILNSCRAWGNVELGWDGSQISFINEATSVSDFYAVTLTLMPLNMTPLITKWVDGDKAVLESAHARYDGSNQQWHKKHARIAPQPLGYST